MALKSYYNKGDLPEGAVVVSEEEALKYQKSIVKNWPSETEVLALKYGSSIAGALALLSSSIISNHFRVAFKADFSVLALTVVPNFIVPYYFSQHFAEKNVTNEILLMKDKCPMCITAKFAGQQFYSSILFPALYSFATNSMYGRIKGTYTFPTDKRYWTEGYKMFTNGAKMFQIVGLLQAVFVLFLPYWQQKELLNISKKSEELNDPELLLS